MKAVKTALSVVVLFTTLRGIRGSGCESTETYGNRLINMCERKTWLMGRLAFDVTSANMGTNTKCNCILRPKTPGVVTSSTFTLWNVEPRAAGCNQSSIHIFSAMNNTLTCTSQKNVLLTTGTTSEDVLIVMARSYISVEVSYCLFFQPEKWEANNTELTCQGDTQAHSSSEASPSSVSLSSPSTPSTQSSTPSSPSTQSSSSSTQSSTSTSSSMVTSTVVPGIVTEKSSTPNSATTFIGANKGAQEQSFLIGPVAGSIGGSVVLIIVIVAIALVVYKRRKDRQKPARQRPDEVEDHSHDNPGLEDDLYDPRYSTAGDVAMGTNRSQAMAMPSSSRTGSVDGMPAAPSGSPYEFEDDSPQGNGAVNMDARAGSASVTLNTNVTNPSTAAGAVYAVVNKSKGKKPLKPRPAKPPKPAGLSTSSKSADVTGAGGGGGGGDLYAVVDKSRARGGNARTNTSSLPLAVAAPLPVPEASASSSPGLVYADLEEVRDQGRRSAPPRPPANMATETEYALIDHRATANFSSDA